jgi:NAD+ synthase (glutamine-hydrolysing)
MPGFGTTGRTYNNAVTLIRELGITLREVSIAAACRQHFADIGLSEDDRSVTFENAQARERTQILMDIANMSGGMVIGTGDMSELALGWATYNGDQMSMYGVNCNIAKTLVRHLVTWAANNEPNELVKRALHDIVATPVSPELLPAADGEIAQKTEDLVGPYELHDFFLYNFLHNGFSPEKILFLAEYAFEGEYSREVVLKWLKVFFRRFFTQQFKRSASRDGVKVCCVGVTPADLNMPSDASAAAWLAECDKLN